MRISAIESLDYTCRYIREKSRIFTPLHVHIIHDVFQFCGNTDQVLEVQFLGPQDSHLAVATNSEHLKVFEVATWNCQLCAGHTDIILGVTVHKKKNLLATCSKVELQSLQVLFDCQLASIPVTKREFCFQLMTSNYLLIYFSYIKIMSAWL